MAKWKLTTLAVVAALSLTALLFPGINGIQNVKDLSITTPQEMVDGSLTSSFTSQFDEKINLNQLALTFWTSIKYHLFHEGNPGVLIGEENWLFTTEEFDEELTPDLNLEDFLDILTSYNETLKSEGIDLTILLIPSKSRIMKDQLGRYTTPGDINNRYEMALDLLKSSNISVIDIHKVFAQYEEPQNLYYRYDTHWTEEGTTLAAQFTAASLQGALSELGIDKRVYYYDQVSERTFHGDLLAFVPPLKDKSEIYFSKVLEERNPPLLGLFDSPVIPFVLVGTSYSFDEKWNFESSLKMALQSDILNLAKEGKGPLEPMKELMESGYYKEVGASMILWEIPERYIPLR